jgi:transposase-like protein
MTCRAKILRTLTEEDASTLRQLRAAALAGRRVPSGGYTARPTVLREAKAMAEIARQLDVLARSRAADPVELGRMAEWLRGNQPKAEQPPPRAPENRAPGSASAVLNAWLHKAHGVGYTLEAMAEVIGVSRERVRQLVAKAGPVDDIPPVVGVPSGPEYLPWPTVIPTWRRWPRPTLSDAEHEELRELYSLAVRFRGQCGPNDPRRIASEQFSARLAELIDRRGFTYDEVAALFGITKAGVRRRLAAYGYRTLPPSQRPYREFDAKAS